MGGSLKDPVRDKAFSGGRSGFVGASSAATCGATFASEAARRPSRAALPRSSGGWNTVFGGLHSTIVLRFRNGITGFRRASLNQMIGLGFRLPTSSGGCYRASSREQVLI